MKHKRMGGEIIRSENGVEETGRCAYCGARLNYAFYFCLSCATPYKALADVLPEPIRRAPTESELIRRKAPKVWVVFWTYAVVLLVGVIFHALIEGENDVLYTLIFMSAVMVGTTLVFEVIYWRSLVVQLKQVGFNRAAGWLGLLLLGALLPLNLGYTYFLTHAFEGVEFWGDQLHEIGLGAWGNFVVICLLPAITEEIAFRGLIQHWLQTAIKPWRAMVLASALFTGIHLTVLGAPYLFLVGMVLGWVKWKTGSLYPSMVIHLLHNWAVISLFPLFFN